MFASCGDEEEEEEEDDDFLPRTVKSKYRKKGKKIAPVGMPVNCGTTGTDNSAFAYWTTTAPPMGQTFAYSSIVK